MFFHFPINVTVINKQIFQLATANYRILWSQLLNSRHHYFKYIKKTSLKVGYVEYNRIIHLSWLLSINASYWALAIEPFPNTERITDRNDGHKYKNKTQDRNQLGLFHHPVRKQWHLKVAHPSTNGCEGLGKHAICSLCLPTQTNPFQHFDWFTFSEQI